MNCDRLRSAVAVRLSSGVGACTWLLGVPSCSSGRNNGSPEAGTAIDGGALIDSAAAMDGAATTADASDGGMAETATDSSSADSGRDGESVSDASPLLPDAGAGCLPSGDQSMLSAAAEGLPSSGLVLWLRADRGIYILQTDAGSTS